MDMYRGRCEGSPRQRCRSADWTITVTSKTLDPGATASVTRPGWVRSTVTGRLRNSQYLQRPPLGEPVAFGVGVRPIDSDGPSGRQEARRSAGRGIFRVDAIEMPETDPEDVGGEAAELLGRFRAHHGNPHDPHLSGHASRIYGSEQTWLAARVAVAILHRSY
jgi:hypothetical protein